MRWLLSILMVTILGVLVWVVFTQIQSPNEAVTIDGAIQNPTELRAQIKNAIIHLGPAQAYTDIAFAYRDADFNMQHNMAHILGEELLASEGIEGIQYCDPRFAFGCYHGFFTNAVSKEGLESVAFLDTACGAVKTGTPGSCRHGIGHGLVEYFGADQLEKALELCKKTTQPNPLAGCMSGVFMEYNIPLRYTDDGSNFFVEPRSFDAVHPYAPCPDVSEEFRASCYHELPQYWARIFDNNWRTLGLLCLDEAEVYQDECFHGMGNVIAPSAQYDPEQARDLCNEIPHDKGSYICRVAAAWSVTLDGAGVEASRIICPESVAHYNDECPVDSIDTL